ncbi:interferon-induced very large GTPase 1-like [Chanos chanos]|uniref:Interferon-induced very large GTPase 1-like n=1 Tax=Chanos chanos TaxID=29144 RepID=A0A6J2VTA3_CHACN|nr:interferon-induced very large GTPase 1-like [Chanos chanos]
MTDVCADADKFFDFGDDDNDDDIVIDESEHIHPMDIYMSVFHCSDDLARQCIFTKLSTCQFAVPLLVPDPCTGEIEIPVWPLQQIKKTLKLKRESDTGSSETHMNSFIGSVQVPTVSFIRLGTYSNSKSQIMNNIISRKRHPTFFSRHCSGSTSNRLLLEGVAEISWYCPGGREDDILEDCIAFINLHGDGNKYARHLKFIQDISSVIVLLLPENLDPETKKTAESLLKSSVPVIPLLSGVEKKSVKKGDSRIAAKNRNEAELSEEIINRVKQCLSEQTKNLSLDDLICRATDHGFIASRNSSSNMGRANAEKLMDIVMGKNHQNNEEILILKGKFLPLQGEQWRNWCTKDKQFYRLESKAQMSIEQQRTKISEEKQCFRKEQQKTASSPNPFMEHLLKCMVEGEDSEKLISEKIECATFGFQHIIREIGQLYESFHTSDKAEFIHGINTDRLPEIGAQLMLSGFPFEVMDGDVSHVPLEWVTAVLNKLTEELGDKRVLVLSVLGLQSSGKSTLLNTMFGLQFAVSSGRCTRGVFMQLIPVEEHLRCQLSFDFILVMDTEGLRSIEAASDLVFNRDNELATFIVGISDITLINIMGENLYEIQNILQICFQAFLRMKSVNIKPSCIFVHQNVSETTAKHNNQEGRRQFIEKLDEISKLAAEEENQEVDGFNDIIQFDPDSQMFYFKNLFEGDPPMAPPNPSDSQNVQELKTKLLSVAKWQTSCKLLTLSEFTQRFTDLWTALLHENFIFNFRNSLDVSIYNRLEHHFGQWSWTPRKYALETQNNLCYRINNKDIKSVDTTVIDGSFGTVFQQVKHDVEKYFKEQKHSDILSQWRGSTDQRLENLKRELIEETRSKGRAVLSNINFKQELERKKTQYEADLSQRSEALAFKLKDRKISDELQRDEFNNLWNEWKNEVSKEKPKEEDVNIQAMIDNTLLAHFQKYRETVITHRQIIKFDVAKYVKASSWRKILKQAVGKDVKQAVESERSAIISNVGGFFTNTFKGILPKNKEDVLEAEGNEIIRKTEEDIHEFINVKNINKFGVTQNIIYELLHEIQRILKACEKTSTFEFTEICKVEISVHVCNGMVHRLTKLNKEFQTVSDPLTYFDSQKEDYFQIFKHYCEGATTLTLFVSFLTTRLKSSIREAVFDKLSIHIVEDMKSNHPAFVGTRSNLEKHILTFLAEKEDFDMYMEYIHTPKQFFAKFISDCVQNYFSDEGEILKIFISNWSEVTDKLLKCFASVERTHSEASVWLDEICSELNSLIPISREDFRNIEKKDIEDWDVFHDLLAQSLKEMLEEGKKDIKKLCGSGPLLFKFKDRPDDILIKQMSGCWEQCPFCKAVCTNTIPNHDSDHSTEWHRCQAVVGVCYRSEDNQDQFCTDFCTSSVNSDKTFQAPRSGKWIPFTKYREAGIPYSKWEIKHEFYQRIYWRWFICTFKSNLEEKYQAKFDGIRRIPQYWEIFTKRDVLRETCGLRCIHHCDTHKQD